MNTWPFPVVVSVLTLLLCWSPPAVGAAIPGAATAAYADGLEALESGRWSEAGGSFTKALEPDGDHGEILLARAVALILAGEFGAAQRDLDRAHRLTGRGGREVMLWIYAFEAMSGILILPEHALGGGPRGAPAGRPVVVSIPGHVAQGGRDYPTEYGSFVVYQLAMASQKHRLPEELGGSGDPAALKGSEMRGARLRAGQMFAERNWRRPELASVSLSRPRKTSDASPDRTPGASADLVRAERVLATRPGDPDARLLAAHAWLAAGHPVTARAQYTMALTLKTDLAEGYLGRARAAARMGDERRVAADLESLRRLGRAPGAAEAGAIQQELRGARAVGVPEVLLKELYATAEKGGGLEELRRPAAMLVRSHAARRLRYDESYQDRLRELEDGIRGKSSSAEARVALAAFLVNEADNRSEVVEPRREPQWHRFQVSRESELLRAVTLADEALALQPNQVGGLLQKAMALTALRRYDEAEALAQQALSRSARHPEVLRLNAKFRSMRANQLSGEAWSLRQERCTSSSHDETRSDGVYRVTTTTCIPPSSADLRRADQLEASALELRRRGRAALESAAALTEGSVEGWLIRSDLAWWDGKAPEAQSFLEKAVTQDPGSVEAQDRLVRFLVQTGQAEKADERASVAANLRHSTAGPLLHLAWVRTGRAAWHGARAALERAAAADPSDGRVPACRGVVDLQDSRPAEARAHFLVALAMEEARLAMDENPPAGESPLPRDPMEDGVAIQARLHLAAAEERSGQIEAAFRWLQPLLNHPRRWTRGWESRQMFTALWPDQAPERGAVVPAPWNAATLMADVHLRSGKCLSGLGRQDEAVGQFRSAAMLGPLRMAGIPRIGNGRGDSNFSGIAGTPAAEAQLLLATELVKRGDAEGARKVLWEAGTTLPDSRRAELNELNLAIARLGQGSGARPPRTGNADPEAPASGQDLRRNRQAFAQFSSRARVPSELVGRWELSPANRFLPPKTLRIESNARFELASGKDGPVSRGVIDVKPGRHPETGRVEPKIGQMLLMDEGSGDLRTLYHDFTRPEALELIDMDGMKYRVSRVP